MTARNPIGIGSSRNAGAEPYVRTDKPIVSVTEIGLMFGVTRGRANQLANGPTFPAPYVELACGRIWKTRAVEKWARKHRPKVSE